MADFFLNVYAVIVMFLLFGLTIFVHELGHFIAAIKLGLVVETFSIGFGPSIWKKKHNGILYKIGWIPFGGYVALPQLDPGAMEGIQGTNEKKDDSGKKKEEKKIEVKKYPEISFWKKIIVSAAGATGNVILAVLFAWMIFFHPGAITGEKEPLTAKVDQESEAYASGLRSGQNILSVEGEKVFTWTDFLTECHLNAAFSGSVEIAVEVDGKELAFTVPTEKRSDEIHYVPGITPLNPPLCKIGEVLKGSPADKAGIELGDVIQEFNGIEVRDWQHFTTLVAESGAAEFPVKVRRRGDSLDLTVVPILNEEYNRIMVGVVYAGNNVPAWMQYKKPGDQIRHDARGIWRILRALTSKKKGVAKQAAGAIGGPLMIFAVLLGSIKLSLLNAVGFVRFLNINLAILNMLPIPVLDGGHIVFALWEGVVRRKAHPRVVNTLVNIFVVLLIGLMVVLLYRDSFRIFPGLSKIFGSDADIEEVIEEGEPAEGE